MDMRIYVASLSDYNAGRLVGEWIDCEGKMSKRAKIYLYNSFHNLESGTVMALVESDGALSISSRQLERAGREVCGMDCSCGRFDEWRQDTDGRRYEYTPLVWLDEDDEGRCYFTEEGE